MQNDYNALVAGVTLSQQHMQPDFLTNSADPAALAVVNAGYTVGEESSEYYTELANVLKVVHVQEHAEISLSIITLKRIFDIFFSLTIMTFGLPVFILLYFITKFTSKGPVFFSQERVGQNGRPFKIHKFRSMYVNAEKHGPQLSRENDPRITKWGKFMRRTRLDELPQFWNVIIGDMSVVGPRPERQFFINKIVLKNPEYRRLQRIKPGITSIGQVEYGYAENVNEMCTRLEYDLLYLKDMSFNSDMRIIFRTVGIMFEKKGK